MAVVIFLFIILSSRFLAAKKGSKSSVPGFSCKDILISGDTEGDGEYWIDPTASGDPFTVFCDMTTDQGVCFQLKNVKNHFVLVMLLQGRPDRLETIASRVTPGLKHERVRQPALRLSIP